MNKKIKALVQKYEKDMQFENRFEDLKDKLDLIPDQNNTNEVYVIRKKLMPAYVMTIVLLMLVTGIIGLQLGLNSNYITGPERVDVVEEQLSAFMDIYQREAIEIIIVNNDIVLFVYAGIKGDSKTIIINIQSKTSSTSMSGVANNTEIVKLQSLNFYSVVITENLVNFDIDLMKNSVIVEEVNFQLDLSTYYAWLLD